jgi:hypothetical protein
MNLYNVTINAYQGGISQSCHFVLADNPVEAAKKVLTEMSNRRLPKEIDPKAGFELRCFNHTDAFIVEEHNEDSILKPKK